MVATLVVPLTHVPPEGELPKVIEEPTQTAVEPEIAAGEAFTVKVEVTKQLPIVYVITDVPAEMPVIMPVAGSIVAIAVALLLQVPPEGEALRLTEDKAHTAVGPVMLPGCTFTVTVSII